MSLEHADAEALEVIAKRRRVSFGEILREAITIYLKRRKRR